jgi:hypothetical protein
MVLNITGALTAARNVICPNTSKLYLIKNSTTGGFAITLKRATGTGISIPNGVTMLLLCDGSNVVDAVTYFSSASFGNLTGTTASFTNLAYTGTLTGGTGVVNVGAGQFYKDASGNLGVGTTSPLGKLHLLTAAATNNYTYTSNGTQAMVSGISLGNTCLLGTISLDPLLFFAGNTERMRILGSGGTAGNVGIGTTSPAQKLSVNGTFSATGEATIQTLTVGLGAGSPYNSNSTVVGLNALGLNTSGIDNTVIGFTALYRNTIGSGNTAVGSQAMFDNISGVQNVAVGDYALYANSSGNYNIAVGSSALGSNTTGSNNIAVGGVALSSNTTGNNNIAIGYETLNASITGSNNIAIGFQSLLVNLGGNSNVAVGFEALTSNVGGSQNVAVGLSTLHENTGGNNNVAVGYDALYYNLSGVNNTAIGNAALLTNTGSNNTGVGYNALNNITTGSGNTAINPVNSAGAYAPVFNPITENNRLCLGSTGVTNAYVQVAWTVVSDARDKTDLAPVPHGLDFVSALRPTAYRYKMNREDANGHGPVRYGFLAQEVLALEGDSPVIVDTEDTEKLRFNDQSMIAVLVNAIQELKAEFDAYKASHP